jgi:hypothetical protein
MTHHDAKGKGSGMVTYQLISTPLRELGTGMWRADRRHRKSSALVVEYWRTQKT